MVRSRRSSQFQVYKTELAAIWTHVKETSRAGTNDLLLHESKAPASTSGRESGLGAEGVSITGASRAWSGRGAGTNSQ